jgi:hypothetical protein
VDNRFLCFSKGIRRDVLFTLLGIALLLPACATPAPTVTPMAAVIEQTSATQTPPPTVRPSLTPPPIPTDSAEAPLAPATSESMVEPQTAAGITIPNGWFSTPIQVGEMSGVVFVQQDPTLLAAFDDPALAVPADFAGGALISTDLPAGTEAGNLEAGMEANLASLGDQDFEAMLLAADRAGLINIAAVDHTVLQEARLDTMAGRPAMVMVGTIHFLDDQPPVLQGEVWLSWTEDAFVTYYALAAETAWSQVEEDFAETRQSLP